MEWCAKSERISEERKLERNARRYERLRQEAGYVDRGFGGGKAPTIFFKGNPMGWWNITTWWWQLKDIFHFHPI